MRTVITLTIIFIMVVSCEKKKNTIDLSGDWLFRIDSLDEGILSGWFNSLSKETIVLPGSMAENGKGNDISVLTEWTGSIIDKSWYADSAYSKYRETGNIMIPFWLQPVKKYTGAAWYQKKVKIPSKWKGKSILLHLERCHWETRLWIDSIEAGIENSLSTPHVYDLTDYLSPGSHTLSLCVDNRIKNVNPGINSHSISDHTQTNWNGITGKIYLTSRPAVFIRNVHVYPDTDTKTVWVEIIIDNKTSKDINCKMNISASGKEGERIHETGNLKQYLTVPPGESSNRIEILLGEDMLTWDEFNPAVYKLFTRIDSKEGKDSYSTSFGMREFIAEGTRFMINGRPVFLRGTLECAIFPETGYPPTENAEWDRIFEIVKAHGLNHMRFHSWCPPEAAFEAADRAGIYMQVECSSWANSGASIGDGKPLDEWLMKEAGRIIDAYGNHPSFCMMAYGNEPAGENQEEWLGNFVNNWRQNDPGKVYTGAAGWPVIPENDYHNIPKPRIQAWGQELESIINSERPRTDYDWSERIKKYNIPVVSHEIGQWCVYPDFDDIRRYNGVLKANNFEIFRETLTEAGLIHLANDYLLASGKLQALCYKAEIEAALRTPGFAGFQLLDLHDFPGQGTALVGILNAFWEEKGYISPEEFSNFCNQTVPLCRIGKRIFIDSDTIKADLEISHFGKDNIQYPEITWKLSDCESDSIEGGSFIKNIIDIDNCQKLGSLNISIPILKSSGKISPPCKLTISVRVNEFENRWDIWIYPEILPFDEEDKDIYIGRYPDNEVRKVLENGGKVLLCPQKGSITSEYGGDIGLGFSSIFWNTAWTNGQKPHTLGILCEPKHPALSEFPTEYHSNWQWWDAMIFSNAINTGLLTQKIEPVVRIIDDWFENRDLSLIFEVRVGNGKLLFSGIDLLTNIEQRPEARQLLYSLKKYMNSDDFDPDAELEFEEIERIFIQ